MSNKYLLTAFSKDRPGIVADISRVIYENGFNLEDSTMTYLAGEFAILLTMSSPENGNGEGALETLSMECRRLEREKHITAFVRPLEEGQVPPKNNTSIKTIVVEGVDQAGIVFKISQYLSDAKINIQTLDSKVKQTPQSGSDLYEVKISVDVPNILSLQKIEDDLQAIGDELNVDIALS